MYCPSCKKTTELSSKRCNNCGLLAPYSELFLNEDSFINWKKERDILAKAYYYLDTGIYYLRKANALLGNSNSHSIPGSVDNPLVLYSSTSVIKRNKQWDNVRINNNLRLSFILQEEYAKDGDLLMSRIGNETYYFIVKLKDANRSKSINTQQKSDYADGTIQQKNNATKDNNHTIYLARFNSNYKFNHKSPKGSAENPLALECTSEQLKKDIEWIVRICENEYKVILRAGNASYGDLLFATIANKNYFFILENSIQSSCNTKNNTNKLSESKSSEIGVSCGVLIFGFLVVVLIWQNVYTYSLLMLLSFIGIFFSSVGIIKSRFKNKLAVFGLIMSVLGCILGFMIGLQVLAELNI